MNTNIIDAELVQKYCVERSITIHELMATYEAHGPREKPTVHNAQLPDDYLELCAIAHIIDDVLTVNVAEGIRITIRPDAIYPFKREKYKLYQGTRIENLVMARDYLDSAIHRLKRKS